MCRPIRDGWFTVARPQTLRKGLTMRHAGASVLSSMGPTSLSSIITFTRLDPLTSPVPALLSVPQRLFSSHTLKAWIKWILTRSLLWWLLCFYSKNSWIFKDGNYCTMLKHIRTISTHTYILEFIYTSNQFEQSTISNYIPISNSDMPLSCAHIPRTFAYAYANLR